MIDVIDMIPSKDMRKALRESGRQFTDMEKATIIANLELTPSRTRELLQQLLGETGDANLREQLQAYLDSEDRALSAFRDDADGCIYGVQLEDEEFPDDDSIAAHFATYQLAYDFGLAQKMPFWVRKSRVHGSIDPENPPENEGYYGFLKFDAEGELTLMGAVDPEEYRGMQFFPNIILKGKWPHCLYFEDRWIELPNLYEQGDIVRVLGRVASYIDPAYDWAVVDVDRSGWEECSARVRSWLRDVEAGAEEPQGLPGDYSDMQITLEFPCRDGTFEHDHINPMFIERWEGEADGDEVELMQMATWDVRGECSLWWTSRVLKKSILKGLSSNAG